jgi:hypothetical protein
MAMEDYEKTMDVLLSVQDKHMEFFENSQSIITDYVEFQYNKLPFLKIKNGLPATIIEDIYTGL